MIIPSIGIHPWYLIDLPDDYLQIMEKYLVENSNLQIGEIGLDYAKMLKTKEDQKNIFENQLNLAESKLF